MELHRRRVVGRRGLGVRDPDNPAEPLGRAGAWPITGVKTLTTLLLLRLRHKLTVHGRRDRLLLAEEAKAPEFNQFTVEMCRAAGFTPTVYGGTVESIRAAADLVAAGRCLYCVPSSCIAALPGTIWRPLTEPASDYPWSVLWRAADDSGHVRAVVGCAQAMSKRLGWLTPAGQATH